MGVKKEKEGRKHQGEEQGESEAVSAHQSSF